MRLALVALSLLLATPAAAEALPEDAAHAVASGWIDQALGQQLDSSVLTLEPRIVLPWPGGARVRIAATAHGLPVVGWERVLAVDPAGRVLREYGGPLPSGPVDLSFPIARERALEWGATIAGWHGEGELWPARAERVVLAEEGRLHAIWQVDVSAAEPVGSWQLRVDANDGRLRAWFPTMHSATGNVYPENPISSDLAEVELLRLWNEDELVGTHAAVQSCVQVEAQSPGGNICTTKERFADGGADGDFLYTPDPGAFDEAFAEVNMYYHLDFISQWFDDRYSFTHNAPIEGLVNFEMANAFFGNFDEDPWPEVAFGQTGSIDFSHDADVIYHEFMHSVFGQIVNPGFIGADEFGLQWSAGGLNEGSADVLSIVHGEDPDLGEYVGSALTLGSGPLRDLEEDRLCPLDLYGEVHRDGEVWGALAWNLIERIGPDPVADVFYGAITTFPSDVDWAFAGQALVDSAAELLATGAIDQAAHDAVVEEAEASGVLGCSRVNRLDEGDAPLQMMMNVGFFPGSVLPLGQQFSLDAPEGSTELRFNIDSFLTSEPNLGWYLHIRRGEHVFHDVSPVDTVFGTFDIPIAADYDVELEGEGTFELVMTEDSDPPLEPGATYYFALSSRQIDTVGGFVRADVVVTGEVDIEPVVAADDDDDLGDDDDDLGEGDGCSTCSAAGTGGLLLPLLGLRRRR